MHQQYGCELTVAVGVHTDRVVAGFPEGDACHIALQHQGAHLAQQLAEQARPNTVLISPATLRLVAGYVVTIPLGSHILHDSAEALDLHQVVSAERGRSRLQAARAHGLSAFVGRQPELGLLEERWTKCQEGMGQAVMISGEAGIGKSRLVEAFRTRLGEGTHYAMECHCSTYSQTHTLAPVLTLLQHVLGWQPAASAQTKLQSLTEAFRASGVAPEQAVPFLAPLFALPVPEVYPPVQLPLAEQEQHIWSLLLTWLLAYTAQQPVCLVLEDAHWADDATLAWLTLLLEQIRTVRLFVVVTCRPEWVPPWAGRSHVTLMTLDRLTQQHTKELVGHLTGGKALPPAIQQPLLEKTSGVPLFIEEMTKMVLESGVVKETERGYVLLDALPSYAIPSTLQDALMARLDHQGQGKFVAQLGAIVGRTFSYETLAAIAPMDGDTLRACLTQLIDAEIIYQRGFPPQAQYTFKHVLLQETAYQSLLRSMRQHYHRSISEVLSIPGSDAAETQPELVAHHYTEAGQPAPAAVYWLRAGQHASTRSAHAEAIAYYHRGLAVITGLPETPVRWQHALGLNLALGAALSGTKGYAAPEVEQAYLYASKHCEDLDDATQLFPVLRGLWSCNLVRGHLERAHALGVELFSLAERRHEVTLLTEAHRALGTSHFFRGEHETALFHMEHALETYNTQHHGALTRSCGQDTGVLSRVYMAWSWWIRGYPERAQHISASALALAQHLQHALSLACALTFTAILDQCRGEVEAVHLYATQSVQWARQHDFALLQALGTVLQGWVAVQHGQGAVGISTIQRGILDYRATGAELARTYLLALLAESYLHLGQAEAGLAVVAEALDVVTEHGEHWWAAELFRLSGDLLLLRQPSAQDEAAQRFEQAIAMARQQDAQALALRAAIRLSRLWQAQGHGKRSRTLLATVYSGFREGFDTHELREAQALLSGLASQKVRAGAAVAVKSTVVAASAGSPQRGRRARVISPGHSMILLSP